HVELLSRLMHIPWLAFEFKRRSLGAHRQSFYQGQVANDLVGEPVGEVIVRRIVVEVFKWQDRDSTRSACLLHSPPTQHAQSNRQHRERTKKPEPRACLPDVLVCLGCCVSMAKHRYVTALWQFDDQRVILPFTDIEFAQPSAEPR